jgi:dUTP pyrophosphatase
MKEVSPVISNWKYIPTYRTRPDNALPSCGTPSSAGADFCSADDINVFPGETVLVDTGITLSLPEGYFLDLRQRSGLSIEYPNYLANCAGVIDSDYRGTIKCIIHNTTKRIWRIRKGDRIAQGILMPYMAMRFQVTDTFPSATERGDGGFGSTGR